LGGLGAFSGPSSKSDQNAIDFDRPINAVAPTLKAIWIADEEVGGCIRSALEESVCQMVRVAKISLLR